MEPQPRYILHQALGAGGMGVVHLGTLVSSAGRRRVAIKQLAARGGIDERARARLVAEARLVFRLTHTNICQVLDLGENERGTFVVMELVPGLDLRALLAELRGAGRALDVASATYIGREVARALDYAHRRTSAEGGDRGAPLGLVHGDVTPQNVLLSVEGEVKLTDFGIAHALGADGPGAGLRGGTRGYVAPERAGGSGDHRADIYALGVTLVVALTGEAAGTAIERLPELPALRPDVSPALHAILRRAVAPSPAARFLSAAELERELSLELARRFPAFTPSELAHIVRQFRHRSAVDDSPEAETDTLTSLTLDAHAAAAPQRGGTMTALPRPRRWLLPAVAAVGLAAAGAVAARFLLTGETPAPPLQAPPPVAGGREPPAELPKAELLPVEPSPPEPSPPPPPVPAARPAHRAREAGDAYLTVSATPWGAVYVDGRRVAEETPVYRRRIPAGDHVVHVRYADGGVSAPRRVHVAAGETRTLGFER